MKKTVIISIDNGNYVLKRENNIITNVNMETLVLNGKDLYDNLFSSILLTEKLNIEVGIDNSVIDSKDKRLTNDIKMIIEKIVEKINYDFNF
ncbi:MAG: hypothetical protein ACLSUV_07435 [Bacilli bacterium]|jgi:hypothetical protein